MLFNFCSKLFVLCFFNQFYLISPMISHFRSPKYSFITFKLIRGWFIERVKKQIHTWIQVQLNLADLIIATVRKLLNTSSKVMFQLIYHFWSIEIAENIIFYHSALITFSFVFISLEIYLGSSKDFPVKTRKFHN